MKFSAHGWYKRVRILAREDLVDRAKRKKELKKKEDMVRDHFYGHSRVRNGKIDENMAETRGLFL